MCHFGLRPTNNVNNAKIHVKYFTGPVLAFHYPAISVMSFCFIASAEHPG